MALYWIADLQSASRAAERNVGILCPPTSVISASSRWLLNEVRFIIVATASHMTTLTPHAAAAGFDLDVSVQSAIDGNKGMMMLGSYLLHSPGSPHSEVSMRSPLILAVALMACLAARILNGSINVAALCLTSIKDCFRTSMDLGVV